MDGAPCMVGPRSLRELGPPYQPGCSENLTEQGERLDETARVCGNIGSSSLDTGHFGRGQRKGDVNRMIRQRVRRRGKRLRALNLEALERRELLDGTPVISEFMAVNNSALKDEDGDYSDWIELFNPGTTPVNLQGYWLTDQSDDLTGWRLPSVTLSPGSYQLVFASGKNRDDADGQLHTDFRLNNGGEYLALVAPDGETVLHEYAPTYPPQIADIAYGVAPDVQQTMLVGANASAKYRVPTDNSEQTMWPSVDFDDFNWASGTTGFGYDTGGPEADPMVESILALGPLGYWRFEEVALSPAVNSGTLAQR